MDQVGQQKLFGEQMGSSVTIRAMVGINTPSLKAIRYILEQPGLSFPKVPPPPPSSAAS